MKNYNPLILIAFTFTIFLIVIMSAKGMKTFTKKLFSNLSIINWDFNDIEFRSLGIITKKIIIKNLTLIANDEKPMKINSKKVKVNGTIFQYALSLGGKGNPYIRSMSIENNGISTIKIIGRSTGKNKNRILLITDINKNKLGSISFNSKAELKFLKINFKGNIYLYSEKNNIDIYKIQIESNPSSSNSNNLNITSNNELDLFSFVDIINDNGGTIYINTSLISVSSTSTIPLLGSKSGGIIGIKQPDGTYPRIDFINARNKGSFEKGFTINGTNKYIKYLIIENAGDNGIWISGSKNLIDHVITRYNSDTGIQLSADADSNTINYCYSYRNIDVKTYGTNADGFAPKLSASNTVFNYCFAWDNSDDGWDSYDKEGHNTSSVTYKHSACWNNGNSDVFIGKYDYDNGNPLDKNLWSIQQIINSDPNFENNYNNRKFNISNATIEGENVDSWLSIAKKKMNGNGFKFGSNFTEKSTNIKRIVDYCLAFDHKEIGFDNNNSENFSSFFTNCVSFNNKINYQLPYIFDKWSNNWSFNASKFDQKKMNESLKTPKDVDSVIKNIYSIRDKIIKEVYSNKFPDNINFDKIIDSLGLSSNSNTNSNSNYLLYAIIILSILVIIIISFYFYKIIRRYNEKDKLKDNIEKIGNFLDK